MRRIFGERFVEHRPRGVGVGDAEPLVLGLDEPRPMPNSKRPSLRWSSIATRSAMRAGWFTGGVMLKIAEPTWSCSVRAATKPRSTSFAERCEYSSRKWCSVNQPYLKPARSPVTATATSSSRRRCSTVRCESASTWVGTWAEWNIPNSISTSDRSARRASPRPVSRSWLAPHTAAVAPLSWTSPSQPGQTTDWSSV